MKNKEKNITAIELGSKSIKILVAKIDDNNQLSIFAFHKCPSLKINKGEILNHDIVYKQLSTTIHEIEKKYKIILQNIFLCISGHYLQFRETKISIPILNSSSTVTNNHIEEAKIQASNISFGHDQVLISQLSKEFIIDDNKITDPLNMQGDNLSYVSNVIYANKNMVYNHKKIVQDYFSIELEPLFFSGHCSAIACMNSKDRNDGALVIDIGEGITEYVLSYKNNFYNLNSIAVGNKHIINDVAQVLNLPFAKCRTIVYSHASATIIDEQDSETINITTRVDQENRQTSSHDLSLIVNARLDELFHLIWQDLYNKKLLSFIGNGIILTGGVSKLKNIDKLVKQSFNLPIRIAQNNIFEKEKDFMYQEFTTCHGLLNLAKEFLDEEEKNEAGFFYILGQEFKNMLKNIKQSLKF